jgi:hypothetical protein
MAVPPGDQKSEFYAGFYFRTKSRERFWGWGNPPAQTPEQFADRPWAQLAEWLRSVHSVAKSGAETQIQKSGTSFLTEQEDEAASQLAKQR